ncbi:MAG: hypothetical protein IJ574_02835 [Bacilli bacterium]|nr:hypothetical protein [Bacilli bacterium]
MEAKYFNKYELEQAIVPIQFNPSLSIALLDSYISKYPKDYPAYLYKAIALIRINKLEEAIAIVNYIEKKLSSDNIKINNYKKDLNKYRILHLNLLYLFFTEQYDELYKYYKDNIVDIKKMNEAFNEDTSILLFTSKVKTNRINPNRNDYSYLFRQTIEYQEEDFLKHLERHLADKSINQDLKNTSLFVEEFPIQEVLKEVKKNINSNNKLLDDLGDTYVFKYDGCGRHNYKLEDYFKIVCMANTTNIITMYPSNLCENLPYIDLNYLNQVIENQPKVKRLSQVDKFKMKYNLK